jgi:hypothetical protein
MSSYLPPENHEKEIFDLIEKNRSRKINDQIIFKAIQNLLKNDFCDTRLEVRDLDNGKKEYVIVISE